jgi:hypothetical protein
MAKRFRNAWVQPLHKGTIMKNYGLRFTALMSFMALFTNQTQAYDNKQWGDDILLIINYHFPYYDSINLLKKIYSPYFPNIVFYGPQGHPGIEVCNHYQGWFSYKDIGMAMQKYPGYAGYLLINDDLIINPSNFERFDKTCIWTCPFRALDMTRSMNAIDDWPWWQANVGYPVMQQVYDKLDAQTHSLLAKNIGQNRAAIAYADIAYIPAACAERCIQLCQLYAEYGVFLEIALPTICMSLLPIDKVQYINGKPLWYNGERNHACDYLNISVDYVHPIKLSDPAFYEFIERYFAQLQ